MTECGYAFFMGARLSFFPKNFKRNEMTGDKIAINNAATLSSKYRKNKIRVMTLFIFAVLVA